MAVTAAEVLLSVAEGFANALRPLSEQLETAESFADGLVGAADLTRILRSLPTWFTPRLPALRPALSAATRTA